MSRLADDPFKGSSENIVTGAHQAATAYTAGLIDRISSFSRLKKFSKSP